MAQPTILLADDDLDFLKTTSELIRRKGYQVLTASSPEDAKSMLDRQAIDIAILDLRLRGGGREDTSGLDVAAAISPRIPKIILTASGDTDAMRNVVGLNSEGIPHVVEWLRKDAYASVSVRWRRDSGVGS